MSGYFPESVSIGGEKFAINCGFSTGAAFERLMRAENASPFDRAHTALRLYYPIVPENRAAALEKIAWFYCCGRTASSRTPAGTNAPRALDLDADRGLLYAAFLAQYGVDIEREDMHWWRFRALLEGLTAEQLIVKVMGWRTADASGLEGAARERLLSLKRAFSLDLRESKAATELERRLMHACKTEPFSL